MITQINLDDPRVKRTRHLLQQAFQDLMQEKPFRDLTVQDITDRATVNRATFYAHYQDKYDLLESSIREMFQQLLASKLPRQSQWSLEHLRVLILMVIDFTGHFHSNCHPADREVEPMLDLATQEEIQRVLVGWFSQPIFSGVAGVTPSTMATAWSWAIFGAATSWNSSEHRPAAEELARQLIALLTR